MPPSIILICTETSFSAAPKLSLKSNVSMVVDMKTGYLPVGSLLSHKLLHWIDFLGMGLVSVLMDGTA